MNFQGGGTNKAGVGKRKGRRGNDVNTVLIYEVLKNRKSLKFENITTEIVSHAKNEGLRWRS